ncbi:MAG: hypothetical protein Q7R95_00675 [bacterium]|nr:hypothetical protein [bacterium]
MSFLVIFILFLTWRIIDFLVLILIHKFLPYLGFFPYKEILPLFHLPEWLTKLANFDGTHYLLISQQGYMTYEQAYFPLYSILIRLFSIITHNEFISAFIISNGSFLVGLWIFSKLLKLYGLSKNQIFWSILFLLLFPTSFFYGAIYTEGLFFLLFTACLYFLKKKNYLAAGICAFFASLTRLIGVFLIIPIGINLLQKLQTHVTKVTVQANSKFQINKYLKNIFSILNTKYQILFLSPLIGLATYMTYLWITVKDPLYFFSSQPIFGAHRSTNLILFPQVYWRYFKIMFTANHDFQYFVSLFEMSIFTLVFIFLIFDLFNHLKFISNFPYRVNKFKILNYNRFALSLFSLANLLLPTLTGTFSSIPRYALFSISFFVFLSQLKNSWFKLVIAILFFITHVILLGFFAQGYFVG